MLGVSMDAPWHLTHADCRPFVFFPPGIFSSPRTWLVLKDNTFAPRLALPEGHAFAGSPVMNAMAVVYFRQSLLVARSLNCAALSPSRCLCKSSDEKDGLFLMFSYGSFTI